MMHSSGGLHSFFRTILSLHRFPNLVHVFISLSVMKIPILLVHLPV